MLVRLAFVVYIFFAAVEAETATVLSANSSDGSHQFPVKFFKVVEKSAAANTNIVVAPFSLEAALSMCYVGARNITRDEIGQVLGIPSDNSTQSIQNIATRFQAVNSAAENYVLASANAMYLEKSYQINPDFQQAIEINFATKIAPVDFKKQPEVARENINKFVESKTNNRIRNLFGKGAIGADTRMVLINAVYFKANWDQQFDSKLTSSAPFLHAKGQTNVKMMQIDARFLYSENEELGVQILELPYKHEDASMVILLPKVNSTVDLEQKLTSDRLVSALQSTVRQKVQVYLPKFKLEKSYDLVGNLKTLGMKSAFSESADFSGVSSRKDLRISKVIQKVFIEVDEKGTEAAAATGVEMMLLSAIHPEPTVFRVDRPFLFLIRHIPTQSVLFMGRISDPTAFQ